MENANNRPTAQNVSKLCHRYVRQCILITAALSMLGLIAVQVWFLNELVTPLIVSAVFSLVVGCADALVWRKVALNSPESLPTFHSSLSGFRMLLALAVMFVYYMVDTADTMLEFFLVFMTFYVALMAHHVVFFTRVAKKEL